ncbi:BREX system P-loop protein BrxC [Deferribacterales bacterium Es71-Z0220]|uniref:BREX system P-loop protein BrxC n=1 Tax=Deferrivibrio essentukiensis TaxID=2880922 RepID=UPI001F616C19|nr:BREX system P-loop protein BrxC [Deferrivibrio essentukiensis]MCB4205255.1 BREX system P-loop protein BrxC [Deferrivibrio essentukiensis]
MIIKNIFEKDIERPINGVVKVGQDDLGILKSEIEEYIITHEVKKYLDNFFSHYVDTLGTQTDKIGIWISGFFGSGKSHLLKMLAYTIENRAIGDISAGEIIRDKIKTDALLSANIKRAYQNSADIILFNIDSMSDSSNLGNKETILNVFRRVFYDKLGYLGRVPFIAEIERDLDNNGLYEKFKNKFEELAGKNWVEERHNFAFYEEEIFEALAFCYDVTVEKAENFYKSKEDYFSSVSISDFADNVKEFIDKKNKELNTNNYRLLFMVDEVGQFIAQDTNKMLNLQTIVEELGVKCKGSAWVVVTSQEDVESIIGDLPRTSKNEFSKILGRFIRFSLSGSNTDEVIKKRILSKNVEAADELKNLYENNINILKNQFSFTADTATFQKYKDENDFINSYPFVPYQFTLLQKVFEAIRTMGISGKHLSHGERSMLNAFQQACLMIKNKEIGYISPFYLFYDTIEGFMDSHVLLTIKHAEKNESLDIFDVNLLKLLFLIRYIGQIKPNIDNIVILMLEVIDQDKQALKDKVKNSLLKLEHEVLINKSGDNYYFLTNEERDIKQEIKKIAVDSATKSNFIYEIIFHELYPETKHKYTNYSNDYEITRTVDNISKGNGKLEIKIATQYDSFDTSDPYLTMQSQQRKLLIRLNNSNELEKELKSFLQTNEYIRKHQGSTKDSFSKVILEIQKENDERRKRLKKIIDELLANADYFSLGTKLHFPKPVNYQNLIKQQLDEIIGHIYNKMYLIVPNTIKASNEIKEALSKNRSIIGDVNTSESVENEIINFIRDISHIENSVTLKKIYDRFKEEPFGWKLLDIQYIIAILVANEKIHLEYQTQKVSSAFHSKLEELITKASYQSVVYVKLPQVADEGEINKAKQIFQDVSDNIPEEKPDDFTKQFKKFITEFIEDIKSNLHLLSSNFRPKFTAEEYLDGLTRIAKLSEQADVIKEIIKQEEKLHTWIEYLGKFRNFITNQLPRHKDIIEFINTYKDGIEHYDYKPGEEVLEKCEQYMNSESPFHLTIPLANEIDDISQTLKEKLGSLKNKYIDEITKKYEHILEVSKGENIDISGKIDSLDQMADLIRNEIKIENVIARRATFIRKISSLEEDINREINRKYAENNEKPPKKIKISKLVYPKIISTKEDIDNFTDELKERLYQELQDNKKIEISGE